MTTEAQARTGQAEGLPEAEIREMEPVMLRFALRATGNPDLSRDLVQDALLAALTAKTFMGRSKLRTWLIGILSHKVIDHYRQTGRDRESDDDPDLLAMPSHQELERTVAARQQLAIVGEALLTLPERERLVLLLNAEGVESAEICNTLGVSATNLRVLLHRGRHRLRRRLEREPG